jgi:hypothetical protein
MTHQGNIEQQLHESTLPLLEALQSQLVDLRSYGSDEIQNLVSGCEQAVAEIARELGGIVTSDDECER